MPNLAFQLFSSKPENRAAIIFVHGFNGDLRNSWRNIPTILHPDDPTKPRYLDDWDLAGFGYSSSKWFDLAGLRSADATLTEVATMLYTQTVTSAKKYDRIAFIAHSMGGIVVQQAIVTHDDLRKRVSQVVLFGTPSNGLVKASVADFWKRHPDNLAAGGPFITSLRKAWDNKNLTTAGGFDFLSVVGEKDQFVPPQSSLQCFPATVWRVIPGNHLTMLEGDTASAPAVETILEAFKGEAKQPKEAESAAYVTIEKKPPLDVIPKQADPLDIIHKLWPEYLKDRNAPLPSLDDYGAGQLVMALAKRGDPEIAINLLSAHAKTREIRIFLASSSELRDDRDDFDLYFRQQNDQLRKKALYLKIVRWETFLDAMSETRLQDEYNKAICNCDVFVALFFTKTGKFTEEEFDVAHGQFLRTEKPLIYTFFKNADIKTGSARKDDLNSLWAFQEKLGKLGHYYTEYDNIYDLKLQFSGQLDMILEKLDAMCLRS